MRQWLTPFIPLLFGTCCGSAQLQFTQEIKVLQCDQTVIAPNSTIDAGAMQVGLSTFSPILCIVNTGTAPVTLTNITVTGSDFNANGNATLPAVIQPNRTTPAFVAGPTFAPTMAGTRTGQISFTDDAPGSPQTFMLTGTGFTDFGLNMFESVSNVQTVTAGQLGEYLMSVTGASSPPAPSAFAGVVSLSCSNLPPGTSCTFTPSSINLQNGAEFVNFEVKVSTTATAASMHAPGSKLWYSIAAFLALMLALARKPRKGAALIACVLLALVASCGGSSKTTPTPSGTFPFSVNASANGVSHSKTMVLVVK